MKLVQICKRARFKGKVLADSTRFINLGGDVFFPATDVISDLKADASISVHCLWRGSSNSLSLEIDSVIYPEIAWIYKEPKDGMERLLNTVIFSGDVRISTELRIFGRKRL